MTASPKTDRLREMREANAAKTKPRSVFTGITINKGVTLTPEKVAEVLQAAIDNAKNWDVVKAKPKPQKIAEAKQAVEAVSQALASQAPANKSTYKSRDPEARREYMRKLMKDKRAKKANASS